MKTATLLVLAIAAIVFISTLTPASIPIPFILAFVLLGFAVVSILLVKTLVEWGNAETAERQRQAQ